MSEHYPECPLSKHDNCREFDNPKLCAIVREDKACLKKQYRKSKRTHGKSNTPTGMSLPPEFKETVKRIKDKEPELEAIVEREGKFNRNRPEKQPEEDKTNGKI